jgi:hypothetical protein
LVEIGFVETPGQIVLPLANFREGATTVDVSVPGLGQVSEVSSVGSGTLPFLVQDGTLHVSVPLDVVDMLIITRSDL